MITNIKDFKKINEEFGPEEFHPMPRLPFTVEQVIELVKQAFDENVSASVGDYFGSPSAHIEGKDNFLKDLETKLKTED